MNNLHPRTTRRSKSLLFMNQDLSNLVTQLTLNAVRLHLHYFKQPLLRTKATALGFLRTERSPDHDRDVTDDSVVCANAGATGNRVDATADSAPFHDAEPSDKPGDADAFNQVGRIDARPGPSASSLPYVAAHPPLSFNPIRAPGPQH